MRTFMIFFIGFVFGAGGGVVFTASNNVTLNGHDHSGAEQHDGMNHSAMDHTMSHDDFLEVEAASAPKLSIKVRKDPMAGYNLQVAVDGFAFAPQSASLAHVEGEGHAHVYANGVKLGRLYGEWMHLDALPKGEALIEVSLNTNDHRPLTLAGSPIVARTTITVE